MKIGFLAVSLKAALLIITLTTSLTTHAGLLFDGYYKLSLQGQHAGYIVLQYSFDEKLQQFTTNSLVVTGPLAGNMRESVEAVSGVDLTPVRYKYISAEKSEGDRLKSRVIIADFKKETSGDFSMKATVKDSNGLNHLSQKFKKGTFLSSFLIFVMLQNKHEQVDPKTGAKTTMNGIITGNNYVYKGIAEEDGKEYSGEAFVESQKDYKGLKVFLIKNKFKGAEFINYVTKKGESLLTQVPVQGLTSELVGSLDEATQGFTVNQENIKSIFGSTPTGKENSLAKRKN